jgi:hypothetical protein
MNPELRFQAVQHNVDIDPQLVSVYCDDDERMQKFNFNFLLPKFVLFL